MGRKYSIRGDQTVATPLDTALTLTSTTAIRPEIYFFVLTHNAAPADNTLQWTAQRVTAAGTGTSITPQALDPGDPAASGVAASNHTVEPTYTSGAILFDAFINQRSQYTWYGDRGPMRLPALASNGIGFGALHASATPDVTSVCHYSE